jgi:hypothetical protein
MEKTAARPAPPSAPVNLSSLMSSCSPFSIHAFASLYLSLSLFCHTQV